MSQRYPKKGVGEHALIWGVVRAVHKTGGAAPVAWKTYPVERTSAPVVWKTYPVERTSAPV
eukprot:850892-Prymnesium_polylepis.1